MGCGTIHGSWAQLRGEAAYSTLTLSLPSAVKEAAPAVPRPPPAHKAKAVPAAPLVLLKACLLTVLGSNFSHGSPGPSNEPTIATATLVMLMRWKGVLWHKAKAHL